MPTVDSPQLRDVLAQCLPGLHIEEVLRNSGQRLVYFCKFLSEKGASPRWSSWGDVVLKVSEDVHPTIIARLEKEREILDGLRSTYFPQLRYHDVFSERPDSEEKLSFRLYTTIEERIDGGPLTVCASMFKGTAEVVELLRSLLKALTLLWDHPRKIVHRDLKPDNIIIRNDRTPVIIDLGIVREEGAKGLTGTNWQLGPCTPGYASPEQLTNAKRSINFRSDFFSLGVITYELFTGQNPFRRNGTDPLEVIVHRTLNDNVPTLSSLGLATPRLSTLVDSLMSKNAYKRPRTVSGLAAEIDAIAMEI